MLTSEHGLDADSFLTELDGRLRAIQAELRPGVALPTLGVRAMEGEPPLDHRGRSGPLSTLLGRTRPEPAAGDAEPRAREAQPETPSRDADARSPETAELLAQVRVLTETQTRLIAASERLLEAFAGVVEIAAGPFADTEALRQFERALEQLDAVRRVTVRGYEGSDRAILDVELAL